MCLSLLPLGFYHNVFDPAITLPVSLIRCVSEDRVNAVRDCYLSLADTVY